MGKVFEEVQNAHLRHFPHEREAILPFQNEFDVTWGARRTLHGSDFSSYIVRPEPTIRDLFGLGLEVAVFLFDYETVEARTFQAISQAMSEHPLAGRVEPSAYFLVSRCKSVFAWVSDYAMRNPQARNLIPIAVDEIRGAIADRYALRDLIARSAFRRDLFDYRLPINSDIYFFGRETLISELRDQIKKGQNTGLFGLRKTGKTSLLYKVARDAEATKDAYVLYFDCKSPIIRRKSGEQLVEFVTQQIVERCHLASKALSKYDVYEKFSRAVRIAAKDRPICLQFDEIEYITPYSLTDEHWQKDFIDFWQLLWSVQSDLSGLSFIISGVNGAVCETPSFGQVQNPLFGIVNSSYVQGLEPDSLGRMITHFGGQMGLQFDSESIDVISQHYGRHPLLTRLACSYIHKRLEREKKGRPIKIGRKYVNSIVIDCDAEIASYCAHVVSELRDFYPDEYEVIMMAAVGRQSEFLEYGKEGDFTRHLRSYGVLGQDASGIPTVALPVLRNFLRAEFARTSGNRIPRDLIPQARRLLWIEDTAKRVVSDFRALLQALPKEVISPFGSRSVPDSDLIVGIDVVSTEGEYQVFITKMYKALYENVSKGYPDKGAFFQSFKDDWPKLFEAINRIRVYRDYSLHLDVSDGTRSSYFRYLDIDIGAVDPSAVADGWFALQQAVMDELLYAVQVESAKRGR